MSIAMKLKKNHTERGMALPIVLIFVVIMMLLGVTTIRNVTLGEKMSGNLRNQKLAFQVAESALRYCENAMLGTVPAGGPTPDPKNNLAPPPVNLWDVEDNWKNSESVEVPRAVDADGKPVDGLAEAPRCMVENMENFLVFEGKQNEKSETDGILLVYRITARGVGGTENAVVMLQSYLRFN